MVRTRVLGVAAALERLLQTQEVLLTLRARVAVVLPPDARKHTAHVKKAWRWHTV